MLRQLCDDASDTALIENNKSHSKMTMTLGVNEPLHWTKANVKATFLLIFVAVQYED